MILGQRVDILLACDRCQDVIFVESYSEVLKDSDGGKSVLYKLAAVKGWRYENGSTPLGGRWDVLACKDCAPHLKVYFDEKYYGNRFRWEEENDHTPENR